MKSKPTQNKTRLIKDWCANNKPLLILRRKWYGNKEVMWHLIQQFKDREVAFYPKIPDTRLPPIRWLKLHTAEYFLEAIKRYEFIPQPMNLYYSVAKYHSLPMMSYNIAVKVQEQKVWNATLNQNPDSHIKAFDLFLDLDNEDFEKAKADMLDVYELMNGIFGLPVMVAFSGRKGFHVELREEFIPQELKSLGAKHQLELNKRVVEVMLQDKYITSIDTAVFDLKRICKAKYSFDCSSGLVCLPLMPYEIKVFKKEMANPERLLNNSNRLKMGLPIKKALEHPEEYHGRVLDFYTFMLEQYDEILQEEKKNETRRESKTDEKNTTEYGRD